MNVLRLMIVHDGQTNVTKKSNNNKLPTGTDTDTQRQVGVGGGGLLAVCEWDRWEKLENGTRHFDKHLQTHWSRNRNYLLIATTRHEVTNDQVEDQPVQQQQQQQHWPRRRWQAESERERTEVKEDKKKAGRICYAFNHMVYLYSNNNNNNN